MFSGKVSDFPLFKRNFEAIIKASNTHPADAAYYLKQAVPSQFGSLFDDVDMLNCDDVINVLTKKFGSKKVLTADAVNQIEMMDVIQSDEEFLEFVRKLERIKYNLSTIDCLQEISNAFFISMLESKLPPRIMYEWSTIVVEEELETTSKEAFERLQTFLARVKKRVEYATANIWRCEGIEFVTGVSAPVSKQAKMNKAAFELRKMRGMIYRKIKRRKPTKKVNETVHFYKMRVDEFLDKFGSLLSEAEHKIWESKKSRTSQDVSDYCEHISNGYDSDVSSLCVEQVESSSEESASENEQLNSTTGIEASFGKPHEVHDDVLVTEANSIDEDIETRLLQLSLPDVPEDEEFTNPIDDEIETRLLRLKFFRKTWCKEANQKTDKRVEVPSVVKSSEISKHSSGTTSQSSGSPVPESPPSSVQNLAQSVPSCNCMKNTSNQTKVMKQQNTNTNMVPDKIPDLTSMQGMVLVLVLTILKLLNHPKCRPRLSYVPAPFPSQSYSDLETTNSSTTKPIISGKRSLLSMLKKSRCVERCGNVRELVKKVVFGYKTRTLGES